MASKINVTDEPSERLASLAKHHPYAIPKLSLNQLDQILLREEVIHAMDPRCVNYRIFCFRFLFLFTKQFSSGQK